MVTSVVTANVRGGLSRARERHSGHDLVRAPRQRSQHPPRIGDVGGLAENLRAEHHDGVEAQHECSVPEPLRAGRLGLLGGQ